MRKRAHWRYEELAAKLADGVGFKRPWLAKRLLRALPEEDWVLIRALNEAQIERLSKLIDQTATSKGLIRLSVRESLAIAGAQP